MEPAAVREVFDREVFWGAVVRGSLKDAMAYAGRFPEQAERLKKYASIFEEERYLTYDVDGDLNAILLLYQKYYRDAFYLELDREEAGERLRKRLADLMQLPRTPIWTSWRSGRRRPSAAGPITSWAD